jgi:hypothetical protein
LTVMTPSSSCWSISCISFTSINANAYVK